VPPLSAEEKPGGKIHLLDVTVEMPSKSVNTYREAVKQQSILSSNRYISSHDLTNLKIKLNFKEPGSVEEI
jgi:hypothetical protein